jgi:hypothetical protein
VRGRRSGFAGHDHLRVPLVGGGGAIP